MQLELEASLILVSIGKGCFSGVDSASDHDVEFLDVLIIEKWTHGNSSARICSKSKGPNLFESLRVQKFASSILGGGKQHSIVVGKMHLENLSSVDAHLLQSSSGRVINTQNLTSGS